MIVLLSPSKTLDYESPLPIKTHTLPDMLDESQPLIKLLRAYSPAKLSKLMDISDKLAQLNVQRYQSFRTPFTAANARQAVLAFRGDVYDGLDAGQFTKDDFTFAQKHLRILSGLYGLLRPLDLIQPYRLEMGTSLKNPRGRDLYAYWGDRITQSINEALAADKNKLLINLASEEYFKAVRRKALNGELINVIFKENHKGTLKIIGLFAKKARGRMARYIIKNRLQDKNSLKNFNESGYQFSTTLSNPSNFVFIR